MGEGVGEVTAFFFFGVPIMAPENLANLHKNQSLPFQTQLLISHMAHMKTKMKMTHFLKMAPEPLSKKKDMKTDLTTAIKTAQKQAL